MSGISRGSIFFTPALMILSCQNACENMIKFTLRCASGGILFNEKRKLRKERVITDGLSSEISNLEKMVTGDINEQRMKNKNSLDKLFSNITDIQKETAGILEENNSDQFLKLLIKSQNEISAKITEEAELIKKNYTNLINRNNAVIIQKMSKLKETALNEIENIRDDAEKKKELAAKRCRELLDNAKKLAQNVSVNSVDALIRQAETDAENGNYQSGIALSSSAITEIYMEIYRSDAKEQELLFYAQTGNAIAEEISIFLDSITQTEFKNENGTAIVDLSLFMDGQYEVFINNLAMLKNELEQTDSKSTEEIKECVLSLNTLYAQINEACSDAFYLMTYSLQRNEIEKEIFSLLKEKGFNLCDTVFTDGDPAKASERTYKCDLTGEELTISVIPYTDDDSELKTELIVHSNSDDCSEESREQYRHDIISRLGMNSKVENVSLSCVDETKNRNASDTGNKYRIHSPKSLNSN